MIGGPIWIALWLGCPLKAPTPPPDSGIDGLEANVQWAREAVPALLGRKVFGYEEIQYWAQLASATDREIAAWTMMAQPEFTTYWSEMLLEIYKTGRVEGVEFDMVLDSCYAESTSGVLEDAEVAMFVRDNPTTAAPTGLGTVTMSRLLASAVALDDMTPFLRAHLQARQSKPMDSGNNSEPDRRAELAATFLDRWVGREMTCLGCHNSGWSMTDGLNSAANHPDGKGWDRHYPLPAHVDLAMFGSHTGTDPRDVEALFRTRKGDLQNGSVGINQHDPWGIENCGQLAEAAGQDPFGGYVANFAGLSGVSVNLHQLDDTLRAGFTGLRMDGLNREQSPALATQCQMCSEVCPTTPSVDVPEDFLATVDCGDEPGGAFCGVQATSLLNGTCTTCHTEGWGQDRLFSYSATGLPYVQVGEPTASYLTLRMARRLIDDGALPEPWLSTYTQALAENPWILPMPPAGVPLSAASFLATDAWIKQLGEPNDAAQGLVPACLPCQEISVLASCLVPGVHVSPEEALAYRVSATFVDHIWSVVMGHDLRLVNRFARNRDQQGMLYSLTEQVFIPGGANGFSLKELLAKIVASDWFARSAPAHRPPGSAVYDLQTVHDPWVVNDPRDDEAPEGPQYDGNSEGDELHRYPARNLRFSLHHALGWPAPERFPNASNVPLARALGEYLNVLEPGHRSINLNTMLQWEDFFGSCDNPDPGSSDWIDALALEAANGHTLVDALSVLRDRLLGDATIRTEGPQGISTTEWAALESLAGQSLSVDAASLPVATRSRILRDACGVMLQSPQFWLGGWVEQGSLTPPPFQVPFGNVSLQDFCEEYNDDVPGGGISCGNGQLTAIQPLMAAPSLCPPGARDCRTIAGPYDRACLLDPADCQMERPVCDPRCDEPGCCVEASRMAPDNRPSMTVLWGPNLRIEAADGVQVLRQGRWSALKEGEELRPGNMLQFGPGAALKASGRTALQNTDSESLRYATVAGPRPVGPVGGLPVEVTPAQIQQMRRFSWQRYGDSGVRGAPRAYLGATHGLER